ncbi:GNAT family N-acetyltransferase [Elioraea rosea]|uniref:GNAT family N-acetyltransferase n=1 Tax=Elioraea rosea TaxID=2492390 RepID=UPI001183B33A|nr:GNAT family N-acetyltransferase [Elioraea rosea]
MALALATIAERPELAPVVAPWLWEEWGRGKGRTLDQVLARIASRTARVGLEQTVVALEDGVAVATASLTAADADSRPELTPWLASVFVAPEARGRGYARVVVTAVESAARRGGFETLWLFTNSAPALYAGLGWQDAGTITEGGKPYALMRRRLG